MGYLTKLKNAISNSKSNLLVGLDTDINKIPGFIKTSRITSFNKLIIDATVENCAGYKLNAAFYEAAGIEGIKAMEETLKYIPKEKITICDAKRGDIDNTTELYARAYFDNLGFDAVTASPYMGRDSLKPFLNRKNKCTYILALTSNKGSSDFQKLKVQGKPLYKRVVDSFINMKSAGTAGFVFGANYTKEIKEATATFKQVPLLIPGIGAQENDIKMLLNALSNNYFLINASRSIIYPGSKADSKSKYSAQVTNAAFSLNNEIKNYF